jgi:hypothetical protein
MQKDTKERRERNKLQGKGKRTDGRKEGTADKSSHKQMTTLCNTHTIHLSQPADAHLQMTWSVGQHFTFLIPTLPESLLGNHATFPVSET